MSPRGNNGREVIRFDRVEKSFGKQKVLDSVSFGVARGSAFCLMGKSGVGKSVTLKLLIGLLQPDAGRVVVEGKNIPDLSPVELNRVRRRMGFLFQQAALFDSLSLGENVAFPLKRHTDLSTAEIQERAKQRLAQVGLGDHYDKMPAALSGGMRKRAGLARALAMDPEVLLVDEPSAGLDPITAAEIDDLLLKLKSEAGTTMVLVTHNIPSARRIGDRLAFLYNSKILEEGTAQELEESDNDLVRRFMTSRTGG